MGKILKCKKCGDIIQSKHRHDMVWCKCHSIAIDGGDDYFRWAGNKDDIEVYVSESEKDEQLAEQSDLIYHLKRQLNCDYYKPCPRCNNPYGASQFPSKDENGNEIYVCSNCNEKELFYEPLIKQLEEQNDKLIKERDDAILKLSKLLQRVSEQNEELADLEAKLAENDAYKLRYELSGATETIEVLKEQLAEKDKELARLKLLVDSFDKLKQYDKDADLILINPKTCYTDGKELVVKADTQDKISFAVEQLENLFKWCCQNHYTEDSLEAHIEEQIKQLKEGK